MIRQFLDVLFALAIARLRPIAAKLTKITCQ